MIILAKIGQPGNFGSGRADWSEGPGTKPIYMAPKFETSDERYTWLNAVQAVGKGQLGAGTVSSEIAEVR